MAQTGNTGEGVQDLGARIEDYANVPTQGAKVCEQYAEQADELMGTRQGGKTVIQHLLAAKEKLEEAANELYSAADICGVEAISIEFGG